jgi:hypothetical protein
MIKMKEEERREKWRELCDVNLVPFLAVVFFSLGGSSSPVLRNVLYFLFSLMISLFTCGRARGDIAMGTATSAESPKYVSSVDRSQWVKSSDILDIRVSTSHVEDSIATPFYRSFIEQCSLRRDVSEFAPNEALQSAVESLEENTHLRCTEIHSVSQRYLHEVLEFCVSGIDDATTVNSVMKPVDSIPGCGNAYVRNGFFYFFWDTHVGEKCGRLELRNSRYVMDLQMSEVHVPLTYHIVYKGRGVSVLGLIPISDQTRLAESSSPEAALLARQILSAFNMLPFEELREQKYLPTNIEAHLGRDARIYFTKNYNWMPPWLSSRGKRNCNEQRFCTIRLQLLIHQPRGLCCRSFQKDALASDNIDAFRLMRSLLDSQIHEVPKIFGTHADDGPECILHRFRQRGFNYSMLGILLMALYRNVSPPIDGLRAVLIEMFARGIKQYVHIRACNLATQRSDDRNTTTSGGGGGGGATQGASMGGSVAAILMAENEQSDANQAIPSSFIDIVLAVLASMMKFEGAPRPRPATILDPGVPPPTDLFGGDVIPHIYRKFRLLPTDCNLYSPLDDDQKAAIFQRSCQLLGVRIENNRVRSIYPIVVHPNTPSVVAPPWVQLRTQRLGHELLSSLSNRAQWQAHGSGLIPLLRLQDKYRPFYANVLHTWESLQPPQLLLWSIQQAMLSREALDRVIAERRQKADMSVYDMRMLVQLLRKKALAEFNSSGAPAALAAAAEAVKLGTEVLERCRNDFSVQLRRLTSECAFYRGHDASAAGDVSMEVNTLRTVSRFCRPDIFIALDYLQLSVIRHRLQIEGAERDTQRCITVLSSLVPPSHPYYLRALANLSALWYGSEARQSEVIEILEYIAQFQHCPADVLATLLDHYAEQEDPELRQRFDAASKVKPEPHTYIMHRPKYF